MKQPKHHLYSTQRGEKHQSTILESGLKLGPLREEPSDAKVTTDSSRSLDVTTQQQLGLVGTPEPIRYPANWFGRRVRDPELLAQLKSLTLMDEFQLFGSLVAAPDGLREFQ
jgi:hypothetical protein